MPKHIAVLPARKGSKGFPGKNRILFALSVDLIRKVEFFDQVVLTTDDEILIEMAKKEGYQTHRRPDALASDHASIKQAFIDLVQAFRFDQDAYLWLLFIPLVYKNPADFLAAHEILEKAQAPGLCSFIPAKSHPFNCWLVDANGQTVKKFIDNDYYNRQDYPEAWENYNYLCAIKVSELMASNANLVSERSYPVLLSPEEADKQVEIDDPSDMRKWEQKHPQLFAEWKEGLDPEVRARIFN